MKKYKIIQIFSILLILVFVISSFTIVSANFFVEDPQKNVKSSNQSDPYYETGNHTISASLKDNLVFSNLGELEEAGVSLTVQEEYSYENHREDSVDKEKIQIENTEYTKKESDLLINRKNSVTAIRNQPAQSTDGSDRQEDSISGLFGTDSINLQRGLITSSSTDVVSVYHTRNNPNDPDDSDWDSSTTVIDASKSSFTLGDDYVGGTKSISMTLDIDDPDLETFGAKVWYSSNGGSTWTYIGYSYAGDSSPDLSNHYDTITMVLYDGEATKTTQINDLDYHSGATAHYYKFNSLDSYNIVYRFEFFFWVIQGFWNDETHEYFFQNYHYFSKPANLWDQSSVTPYNHYSNWFDTDSYLNAFADVPNAYSFDYARISVYDTTSSSYLVQNVKVGGCSGHLELDCILGGYRDTNFESNLAAIYVVENGKVYYETTSYPSSPVVATAALTKDHWYTYTIEFISKRYHYDAHSGSFGYDLDGPTRSTLTSTGTVGSGSWYKAGLDVKSRIRDVVDDHTGISAVQYSVNGGTSWSSGVYYSTNDYYNSGSIPDGNPVTVLWRAVDSLGNSASWSHNLYVDRTLPSVTVGSNDFNKVTNDDGKITFTFDVSDATSGFATITYQILDSGNNPTSVTADSANWLDSNTLEVTVSFPDGEGQSFRTIVEDNAGNTKTTTHLTNIDIDITPPEISLNNINPSLPTNFGTLTISFDATDNLSGINDYYIELKKDNYVGTSIQTFNKGATEWSQSGNTYTITIDSDLVFQDLPATFYLFYNFVATDGYGNTNNLSLTILVDGESPEVVDITISPNEPTEISEITISAQIDNPGEMTANPIQNVLFQVYEQNYELNNYSVLLTSGPYEITFNLSTELGLDPGNNMIIKVTATDTYGNFHVLSESRILKDSDVDPPIILSGPTVSPTNPTDNDNIIISIELFDQSDLSSLNITVFTDGQFDYFEAITGPSNGINTFNLPYKYDPGTNLSFIIIFTDNSLNAKSNSVTGYVLIADADTTPPSIQIPVHPSNPTQETLIEITTTVTDLGKGVKSVYLHYEINNSGTWITEALTDFDGDNTYNITLSTYNPSTSIHYYIEAQDNSLNINTAFLGSTSSSFSIFVGDSDIFGPTFNPNPPVHSPTNPTELSDINITIEVSDPSGVLWVKLNYTTDDGQTWTDLLMSEINEGIYTVIFGPFPNGTQVIYQIEAGDRTIYENTATSNQHFFNVGASDEFPPVILNIKHYPSLPTELDSLIIEAFISDDSGLSEIMLYYSVNNGSFANISLVENETSVYIGNIGSYIPGTNIKYYIKAIDNSTFKHTTINNNYGNYYSIYVGDSDTNGPLIENMLPNQFEALTNDSLIIQVNVTDESGVGDVFLHYTLNGIHWTRISMQFEGTQYEYNLGSFSSKLTILYYFEAIDTSLNLNTQFDTNNMEYYKISVLEFTSAIIEFYKSEVEGYDPIPIRIIDHDRNTNDFMFDKINVNISSDSDPKGFLLILSETLPDSGIFTGYLEIKNSFGDGTYKLLVSNDDLVYISFTDPIDKDGNQQVFSKSFIWKVSSYATLSLNKDSYYLNETGIIRITDSDLNQDPSQRDIVSVEIWSTVDLEGISIYLEETEVNSAIFTGMIHFNMHKSNPENSTIKVAKYSTLYVYYIDESNLYNFVNYLLLTAEIVTDTEQELIIIDYNPSGPENGDYLTIYASIYRDYSISTVQIRNTDTNEIYTMLPFTPTTNHLVFGYSLVAELVSGQFTYNFVIEAILQNGTTWISNVNHVPLRKGTMRIEWFSNQLDGQGEFNISIFNKRRQYLDNINLTVSAQHVENNKIIPITSIIIDGSVVLLIDPENYDLTPGRWLLIFEASKDGYNPTKAEIYFDITYGIEILPGVNKINIEEYTNLNTSLIIEIDSNHHFWLVIDQIPEPLITELNSEEGYRPLNGSFFQLSALLLEPISDNLFNSLRITLDTSPYDIQASNFLIYYSFAPPNWIELDSVYTDYTIEAHLVNLGAIGLVIAELEYYQVASSPSFGILYTLLILFGILLFKRRKNLKKLKYSQD